MKEEDAEFNEFLLKIRKLVEKFEQKYEDEIKLRDKKLAEKEKEIEKLREEIHRLNSQHTEPIAISDDE
ncbi:Oidioi.mRNA.OKI2018_I69.chr1.g1324.t1.cds [Oikopleura dioica]|uniref:Oidioi.mRNA.OKI2018_I69.chr1.g1324.t1.cds n=1 Tax=Oikopleura dioica TaxID=34765 RepID=A0ABN7SRS7_OIKDI|nr:Oidioi.mRNA.OKI2018_I69.chr1.g1324.t1.cds [Oikopleura dioica]